MQLYAVTDDNGRAPSFYMVAGQGCTGTAAFFDSLPKVQ